MVILAAVNTLLVAPARAQDGAESCGPTRDLALVNGRIYQMNAADATATSVLIRNDKVAAIDPELNAEDVCIDTIDLQGRVVIPGLIDNHIHYVRIANRPGYDTRALETTFTIEAALAGLLSAPPMCRTVISSRRSAASAVHSGPRNDSRRLKN